MVIHLGSLLKLLTILVTQENCKALYCFLLTTCLCDSPTRVSKCILRRTLLAVLWSLAGAVSCVNNCDCHCGGVALQWVNTAALWHCGGYCTAPGWVTAMEKVCLLRVHAPSADGCPIERMQGHQKSQKSPAEQEEMARPHKWRTRVLWPMCTGFSGLPTPLHPGITLDASNFQAAPQSCIWPHLASLTTLMSNFAGDRG